MLFIKYYLYIGLVNLVITLLFGFINKKRNPDTSNASKAYDIVIKLWKRSHLGKVLAILANIFFVLYLTLLWPFSLILGFRKIKK